MNNKNFEQYKRIFRFFAIGLILLAEAFLFKFVWEQYYADGLWLEPFYGKGNTYIVVVYIMCVLLFMYIYGGLEIGLIKKTNFIYSQSLAGLCANGIMYLQIILLSRRLVNVLPILVMTILEIFICIVFSVVFDLIYQKMFPAKKMLMLYEKYQADTLLTKFNTRKDKYIVVKKMNVSEGMEVLRNEIPKYEGIILCDVHSELRNTILKYCYKNGIRAYMTPKISDILIRSSESLHLFDTPLLLSKNSGLAFEQKIIKRLLDIVVSGVFLIVFSPLMLITATAIKLYDKGPVMFRQKRLTCDGKEFYVLKFRSMIVDAEKDGVARLAKKNDSRITPIGKFIRKTRIDEFPQLINVLKGEMSLVGPRPERPEIAVEYEKIIPEFGFRLKVKAGLTGYAQIYGKYNTTAYDKLKLDLMYIQKYSILLDLKLLVMTFKILFMAESTEGVDGNQVTAIKDSDKESFLVEHQDE